MKIRLLSTVICAAMVSTMVMGCSSGASAPATTAAAAAAPGDRGKRTQQQGIRRQPRQMLLWTTAMSRLRLWQKASSMIFGKR